MLFCTLYPEGKTDDLFRDPGQIPYTLAKNFPEVQSKLVTCGIPYKNVLNSIDNFETIKMKNYLHSSLLVGLIYLFFHAKEIDWLNLYHCRRQTLLLSKFYKTLNKGGKVYVKLDAGFQTIQLLKECKNYLKTFHKIGKVADIISAESKVAVDELNGLTRAEIYQIPNGIFLEDIEEKVSRKNIFLTVARIGSPEKNDNLLMEAFAQISNQCNWNLMLVGDVESGFKGYIKNYFEKFPHLKERIIFTGNITSRKELAAIYQSAKVFVLPSSFENFSLACIEALQSGCYVVLSDQVTPYREFTNNFKYGTISAVNNVKDLAEKMLATSKKEFTEKLSREISDYAGANFTWKSICQELYEILCVVG